jgi:hypothetical protein
MRDLSLEAVSGRFCQRGLRISKMSTVPISETCFGRSGAAYFVSVITPLMAVLFAAPLAGFTRDKGVGGLAESLAVRICCVAGNDRVSSGANLSSRLLSKLASWRKRYRNCGAQAHFSAPPGHFPYE